MHLHYTGTWYDVTFSKFTVFFFRSKRVLGSNFKLKNCYHRFFSTLYKRGTMFGTISFGNYLRYQKLDKPEQFIHDPILKCKVLKNLNYRHCISEHASIWACMKRKHQKNFCSHRDLYADLSLILWFFLYELCFILLNPLIQQ